MLTSLPATAVYETLREEAARLAEQEPVLEPVIRALIVDRRSLQESLAAILSTKLADAVMGETALQALLLAVFESDDALAESAADDLVAYRERDPAVTDLVTPLLFFKGFHALQTHRVAHALWRDGRKLAALYLQSRGSAVFDVDIHPAARFGRRVFIDHATGIVVGETAVVDDDVSMLHGVTLGGTGKESGDRHPKVRRGVLLAAGAKILGNVVIGEGAKVGAGSVVLREVPPHVTVAGVPARIVGHPGTDLPALSMDQDFSDFQI